MLCVFAILFGRHVQYLYKCFNKNVSSQSFNCLQNGKILEEYPELAVRVSCPSIQILFSFSAILNLYFYRHL